MRHSWISTGSDDQICDCEKRPGRGEDQEVDLGGGPVPRPVICGYINVRTEAQREEGLFIPYARTARTIIANRAWMMRIGKMDKVLNAIVGRFVS